MIQHCTFAATHQPAPVGAARAFRYRIEECKAVRGEAPRLTAGMNVIRAEASAPVRIDGVSEALQFHGVVQHQNYTAATQRAALDSVGPFEGNEVWCVLIPIHKNDAWWQLPADVRSAYFHRAGEHHQHSAVGAPFVQAIHRRLFHSRYHGGAEAPIPYDFLTYFEFPDAQRGAFQELLDGLRDTVRNPEWAYVDGEFEVWMRRVSW